MGREAACLATQGVHWREPGKGESVVSPHLPRISLVEPKARTAMPWGMLPVSPGPRRAALDTAEASVA